MSQTINRRFFLQSTAAGIALASTPFAKAGESANDRVVVGVMGLSRGLSLARGFEAQSNCEVKTVCDVDKNRANAAVGSVEKVKGRKPTAVTDFRKMLDDNDVDVLVCAAPDHWHAPATILACSAGKHVYVEKPCSHNPREGELCVTAAKKNKVVVQMGNQRRSADKIIEAIKKVHDGEIGDVYYSRSWYANTRGPTGKRNPTGKPPAHLQWDLWQGPAPRIEYDSIYHPYKWHWFWHFGTGEMGNNGIHAIDLSRWGLGVDYPTRVVAGGGRFAWDDDQETPDTLMTTFNFPGKKTIVWEGLSCNRRGVEGTGFGASFHGTKGTIVLNSSGYTHYSATNREAAKVPGRLNDADHFADFLKSIRSTGANGPTQLPNSWIEEGHKSTLLCHLGNIAYRTESVLNCDANNGRILNNKPAEALWSRDYEKGWEPKV